MFRKISIVSMGLLIGFSGQIFASSTTTSSSVVAPNGDGVMINNVSGDLQATSNPNVFQSKFINQNKSYLLPQSSDATIYLFPDFMSINSGWVNTSTGKVAIDTPYLETCPNNPPHYKATAIVNYYSEPLIPLWVSSGKNIVGPCINGAQVTAAYKTNGNQGWGENVNVEVMPMISGSAHLIHAALTAYLNATDAKVAADNKAIEKQNATIQKENEKNGTNIPKVPLQVVCSAFTMSKASNAKASIDSLVTDIATVINGDDNASGVSFDLEGPSLGDININDWGGKASWKACYKVADTYFITQLANALATKNKYVAIFDGNHIYPTPAAPNANWPSNVFALDALYDNGECNKSNPNAPCTVKNYTDTTNGTGFLLSYPTVPVMYVVPASATSQLYEKTYLYNYLPESDDSSAGGFYQGLPYWMPMKEVDKNTGKVSKQQLKTPNTSGLMTEFSLATQCNLSTETGSPLNIVATSLLCQPSAPKTENGAYYPYAGGCEMSQQDVANNFNQACHAYTNEQNGTAVLQEDYMEAALGLVKTAKAADTNNKVMGIALYTVNTTNFNTLNAAKKYYSVYGDVKSLNWTFGNYPTEITQGVWQKYADYKNSGE